MRNQIKKWMSVIIFVLSVLLIFDKQSQITVHAENANDITVGETLKVSVAAGETVYLAYTPKASGMYTFKSLTEDIGTIGYLYNSDRELLKIDEDVDGETNFSFSCELQKGELYFFAVRYYSSQRTGSIPVILNCKQSDCEHLNTQTTPGKEETCYEDGYTEKLYCFDCEMWISVAGKIEANHKDADEDGVCERCERTMPVKSGVCGYYDDSVN